MYMGLFDTNNSVFSSDSSGNGKDISGGMFGSASHLFGKDGSGNPLGNMMGGADNPLSNMMGGSTLDASGTDASGINFRNIGKWIGTSLVAGLVVVLIFISSQNLVYLTSNFSDIPTNIKKPPYNISQEGDRLPSGMASTFLNNILYGYGTPYTFKDNPTVFPFIPCNFGFLRNMFGIKSWIGETLIKTWINSRKFLKVVLGVLGDLPDMIQMPFAFVFMLLMIIVYTSSKYGFHLHGVVSRKSWMEYFRDTLSSVVDGSYCYCTSPYDGVVFIHITITKFKWS